MQLMLYIQNKNVFLLRIRIIKHISNFKFALYVCTYDFSIKVDVNIFYNSNKIVLLETAHKSIVYSFFVKNYPIFHWFFVTHHN